MTPTRSHVKWLLPHAHNPAILFTALWYPIETLWQITCFKHYNKYGYISSKWLVPFLLAKWNLWYIHNWIVLRIYSELYLSLYHSPILISSVYILHNTEVVTLVKSFNYLFIWYNYIFFKDYIVRSFGIYLLSPKTSISCCNWQLWIRSTNF